MLLAILLLSGPVNQMYPDFLSAANVSPVF